MRGAVNYVQPVQLATRHPVLTVQAAKRRRLSYHKLADAGLLRKPLPRDLRQ